MNSFFHVCMVRDAHVVWREDICSLLMGGVYALPMALAACVHQAGTGTLMRVTPFYF
jgi:hypothetical protein